MTSLPDRLRLPLAVDAGAMAGEVAALARADWVRHFVTQNYDGEWDVVPLRAQAGTTHPVMMIVPDPTASHFADTPFLAACPAIGAALRRFRCPLACVRLMRLGPGSAIKEHRDLALSPEDGTIRIHIPILTNPGVDFRLNGTHVPLEAGTAWYLRLTDPHSVSNRGDTERIHLVIDATVDPWLSALLADTAAQAAP
ncbi:MAG: aspartyl/asparaginyl beta-hydroxylase domain-containing protein [Janthinobacterium lividum]